MTPKHCYIIWPKVCGHPKENLDNSVFPTLWQQFVEGHFLFQRDSALVHNARSMKKWFFQFGVEELD